MMTHLNLFDNCELIPEFRALLDQISSSDEPLASNFSQKEFDLSQFLSINLLLDHNRIVAFSGLQYGRWGKDIGRISSRLWVNPLFRKSSVPVDFNSKLFMPAQISMAKDRGLKGVFWSTARASNIKTFQKMIDRNNKNCPHKWNHVALDGEYNVCGKHSSNIQCIQRVAVIALEIQFNFAEVTKYKINLDQPTRE